MTAVSDKSRNVDAVLEYRAIGDYLIHRLKDLGVNEIFGIPGDYILSFCASLEKSPIRFIGCTREDSAGFAADAYARINGIGAVCVTYCVGGLSLCNSIAGAYAEKSPVVVISGSPGMGERVNNPLLHHRVRDFETQASIFRQITVAQAVLNDPESAFRKIDRVLDAVKRYSRPGYIEIPRDIVNRVPKNPVLPVTVDECCNTAALAEAVAEAKRRLNASKRPVIVAGVEIHRFGLQPQLLELAESTGIPMVSTMLGKSVISEAHPLFAGLYEGAMGREAVTRFVEESDCILLLGTFMTDVNLGIYTARLEPERCISATSESLSISHHHFHDVPLKPFIEGLIKASLSPGRRAMPPCEAEPPVEPFPRKDVPIRIGRLIQRLDEALDASLVIIADPGDGLFAASELRMRTDTEFMSPAYYTSMGFAVPAALGVGVANALLRPTVLVGDGAFQMTGMELSTIVRHGLNPIVIVLDNQGYGTERLLHPGDYEFNEIQPWNYARLPEVIGRGVGHEVFTEEDFENALTAAISNRGDMHLIQVHIPRDDASRTLSRLAARLSSRV